MKKRYLNNYWLASVKDGRKKKKTGLWFWIKLTILLARCIMRLFDFFS